MSVIRVMDQRNLTLYGVWCANCQYHTTIGEDYIASYADKEAECPECDGQLWHIRRYSMIPGASFEYDWGKFLQGYSTWLDSKEGKIAQERATWNL